MGGFSNGKWRDVLIIENIKNSGAMVREDFVKCGREFFNGKCLHDGQSFLAIDFIEDPHIEYENFADWRVNRCVYACMLRSNLV